MNGASPASPVLVLDACVLMSGVLRPLLLDLAEAGLFASAWSQRIGLEWRRNAARLWPIAPEVLEQEWALMQERFPQADQGDVSAFEAGLRYSDRKDWHVAAVGIACAAGEPGRSVTVVTWNIKDFSRSELRKLGVGLMDPDRLMSKWLPDHRQIVHEAIEKTLNALVGSGRRQPESFVSMLRRERLFRLARLIDGDLKPPPTPHETRPETA